MVKRGARVKLPILRVPSDRGGFSLPEVLVALTVLAVVVTVLTRVHVGTLRAGSMAQGLDAAVTELGNVAALSRLGVDDEAIRREAEADGWTAQVAPAGLLEGGGGWKAWSVISSNKPAPLVRIYVQGAPKTDSGGAEPSEDGQ